MQKFKENNIKNIYEFEHNLFLLLENQSLKSFVLRMKNNFTKNN